MEARTQALAPIAHLLPLQVLCKDATGHPTWCPARFVGRLYVGGRAYMDHYEFDHPATGETKGFREDKYLDGLRCGAVRRTTDTSFVPCLSREAASGLHRSLGGRLPSGTDAKAWAAERLGRPVASFTFLTPAEADALLAAAPPARVAYLGTHRYAA